MSLCRALALGNWDPQVEIDLACRREGCYTVGITARYVAVIGD